MRTEDGYIIQECLDGESEAFGVLADKYKEGIYAFVYAKLRDFHDAQDVTQEVFLHAYRNLRTLRRWESFASWLYRIASRRCKLWIRAASRRVDRDFIQDQDSKILTSYSMDSYHDDQLSESLQDCINSLSETYREVLTLHYFGGMTIREMSIALGASPTAIGARLSRARAQLREEMVAMMDVAFEGHRLPSGFTFRIVEAVKRIDIRPMPRMAGLPWGMSLAAGITLIILILGSHLTLSNPINSSMDWPLSSQMAMTEVGHISVDILKVSQIPVLSGNMGNGYVAEPAPSHQSDMLFLAPSKEEGVFPQEPAARLGKGTVSHVAYSPDGKMLAVSGSLGIWLYDAETLDEIGLLKEYTTWVGQIAFSPDSKLLAAASWDRQVRLWNVRTQKCVGVLKGTRVAFSPDGEFVGTTREENFIRIWDVNTQQIVVWLFEHEDWVECIAFSPDGKTLATASPSALSVCLWDVGSGEQLKVSQGYTNEVTSIVFTRDGKNLISAGYGTICFWDVETREQTGQMDGDAGSYSIDLSPDEKLLASTGGLNIIKLWDFQQREEIGRLYGHTLWAECAAFSPDGSILATGGPGLCLWNVNEQKRLALLREHANYVLAVAFSPDGKWLASGSRDGTILLWEVNAGQPGQAESAMLPGHKPLHTSAPSC